MGRGWMLVMMLAAAALVVKCHGMGGWKDEEMKVIHVGGKVMCQDCTKGWDHWLHGATPLKGCRVAITCMDQRKRVVYYSSDETDEGGEFEMVVNKYMGGKKELKPEHCSVRLVSSPHQDCNIATDFAGGRSGVKLTTPSHVYRDLIKYTLGPLYFTSPMCDEPNTSSESDEGSGY